jgi:hypothetical protein
MDQVKRRFLREYRRLNEEGACDSAGSTECNRAWREWLACARPEPLEGFIRGRANLEGAAVDWASLEDKEIYVPDFDFGQGDDIDVGELEGNVCGRSLGWRPDWVLFCPTEGADGP